VRRDTDSTLLIRMCTRSRGRAGQPRATMRRPCSLVRATPHRTHARACARAHTRTPGRPSTPSAHTVLTVSHTLCLHPRRRRGGGSSHLHPLASLLAAAQVRSDTLELPHAVRQSLKVVTKKIELLEATLELNAHPGLVTLELTLDSGGTVRPILAACAASRALSEACALLAFASRPPA
jgi:hypothetical protein